ncbi:MAG: DUF2335 domain-containing protein, partial [Acidobacteriaceae bacterium]
MADPNPPESEKLPAEIEKIAGPVILKLPEQLRPEVRGVVRRVVHQTIKFHSGPLPDPETLEGYARLIPNGAERLLKLVENEAAHRHAQEAILVSTNARLSLRGQLISAGLVLLLTGIGVFLTLKGFPT